MQTNVGRQAIPGFDTRSRTAGLVEARDKVRKRLEEKLHALANLSQTGQVDDMRYGVTDVTYQTTPK